MLRGEKVKMKIVSLELVSANEENVLSKLNCKMSSLLNIGFKYRKKALVYYLNKVLLRKFH